MRRNLAVGVILGLVLLAAPSAWAVVIQFDTSGGLTNAEGYRGLSLTTPASATAWNNIELNFFSPTGAPTAAGTLYLLSAEYLGTPSNLSAAPGQIATSLGIASGAWFFDPAVTLLQSTTYYFYSDALFASGTISGPAGALGYWSTGAGSNFVAYGESAPNYSLSGSPVPEPTTLLMIGAGLLGLGRRLRSRLSQ